MINWFKKRRCESLDVAEFSASWEEILRSRFPIYGQLSEADRSELESRIRWFLGAKRLQRSGKKGTKTVLHHYGGSHPAEFFAVATECFFEKPRQLLRKHLRLYAELQQYDHQEPAGWFHEPAASANQAAPRPGANRSARYRNRTSSAAGSRGLYLSWVTYPLGILP